MDISDTRMGQSRVRVNTGSLTRAQATLFGTCFGGGFKGVVSKTMLLQVVSVIRQCCLQCCFERIWYFETTPYETTPYASPELFTTAALFSGRRLDAAPA